MTLAVGTVGGSIAHLAGLPLAWLLGAMWIVVLLSGKLPQVDVPRTLRRIALAVIGCFLGINFTPEIVSQVAAASHGIVLAIILTSVLTAVGALVLKRLHTVDNNTAVLASVPGGLSMLIALAADYRSEQNTVALMQVIRIMVVASIVPLWARIAHGEALLPAVAADPASAQGLLWIFAAIAAGTALGHLLNSAQFCLLGSIAAGGLLSVQEVQISMPPDELLAAAQIVLGASIGARMSIPQLAKSGRIALLGFGLATLFLALSAAAAVAASKLLGGSFMLWLLALAPGGIAEISLMAQLLGLQPVFVLTVQLARLVAIILFTPLLLRVLGRKSRKAAS